MVVLDARKSLTTIVDYSRNFFFQIEAVAVSSIPLTNKYIRKIYNFSSWKYMSILINILEIYISKYISYS